MHVDHVKRIGAHMDYISINLLLRVDLSKPHLHGNMLVPTQSECSVRENKLQRPSLHGLCSGIYDTEAGNCRWDLSFSVI